MKAFWTCLVLPFVTSGVSLIARIDRLSVPRIGQRLLCTAREVLNIPIPLDKLEIHFSRSSGPGGQNVNKLNTKAELRFNVHNAHWIPDDTRNRLIQYQENRINNEGELLITCQEHRTQGKNKDGCISKLKEMLAEAAVAPKERKEWEGIGEIGKQQRKMEKKKKSEIKQSRRIKQSKDWD